MGCLYSNATNIALGRKAPVKYLQQSRRFLYNNGNIGNGIDEIYDATRQPHGLSSSTLGKWLLMKYEFGTAQTCSRTACRKGHLHTAFPVLVMIGRDPFDVQLNQIGFKNNLRDSVCKSNLLTINVCLPGTPENTQGRYVRLQIENLSSLGGRNRFCNFGLTKEFRVFTRKQVGT